MFPRLADMYKIIVIEDRATGKLVGSGSVIIERKFIRNTGLCAHIEDIVVDKEQRGARLGLRIIKVLSALAEVNGCYKVILDCEEHNVKFYEKCGFKRKEVEMAKYFDQAKVAEMVSRSVL